jgi:uncharacterized protein (DUF305 family)
MKNTIFYLAAIAVLFTACNQAEQKNDHAQMKHGDSASENVMMQAMDKSMVAMHKVEPTGNADYDFASMMIPHHEGAIDMAENLLKQSNSASLTTFAKEVIVAQKKEILMLREFLITATKEPIKDAEKFKKAMEKAMMPMMEKVKLSNNIDRDFVMLMIPHHQSAINMAKAYLPYAGNAQLKSIAQQIFTAQEEEIKFLKKQ